MTAKAHRTEQPKEAERPLEPKNGAKVALCPVPSGFAPALDKQSIPALGHPISYRSPTVHPARRPDNPVFALLGEVRARLVAIERLPADLLGSQMLPIGAAAWGLLVHAEKVLAWLDRLAAELGEGA